MNETLYQQAIKDLAAAAHGSGSLAHADRVVRLDNPLCGDRIDLELNLADGAVSAIAHRTRGCLLCRAAASLLGLRAPGLAAADAAALQGRLVAMLTTDGPVPPGWAELEAFLPARAHRARHDCIILPFAALHRALALPR